MERRQLVLLALALSLVIGGLFWSVKSVQTATLGPSPVQPDSMVYFQYARAIADGHPYRFTPDQPPSTGSTSHLYPFVLAALIKVAGVGHLETASFAFNGLCHAVSLALVALIAWRLDRHAAPVAVLLAALSGHLAMTVFSDCDMSLFVPLALGVFAAAVHGRTGWLAGLLVAAAWTRPEGIVMSVLLLLGAGSVWLVCLERRAAMVPHAVAGAIGVAASVLVLLWNHHLTGHFGFQSTEHKSWFAHYPWTGALMRSSQDFTAIWTGAFWGFGSGVRPMMGIPLLGGALCLAGLAVRPGDSPPAPLVKAWWIASMVAATGMVAIGGWAGAVFDRYLGWITPFVCIYAAIGLAAVAGALRNRALLVGGILALAALQSAGAAFFVGVFGAVCADTAAMADFGREACRQIGKGRRICASGEAGLAFYLPGHSVANLQGIVSPQFAFDEIPEENIFKFGRDFPDYFLLTDAQAKEPWIAPLVGKLRARQSASGSRSAILALHEADRAAAVDAGVVSADGGSPGARPRFADILRAVGGMELRPSDRAGSFNRMPGGRLVPQVTVRFVGTNRVMSLERVIIGSESFAVATKPGRGIRAVMRTAPSAEASMACADGQMRVRNFDFASPLRLLVQCGGRTIQVERPIGQTRNSFDEIVFDIPAELITSNRTAITIGGDHVSLAHWFYQ